MNFEVRYQDFTFKHSFSEKPDLSEERFKEHFHTVYELLYFVRGNADFMIEHRLYKIKPGSLLIAKPGEYHNIVFRSEEPYERYVLRFPPYAIHRHVRLQLERTHSVYNVENSLLAEEFHRMDEHMQVVQEDLQVALCIGSLNIIAAHLISSEERIQHADYVNNDARRILKYIEQHLPEIHSAEEIAQALHVSKSALYKIFTQQLKTPLMTYVRTQQCMAARNLMLDGISATEAADRLGFQHYSSFYRDYVQIFGTAPTEPLPK